jgi:GNAT superfamily N-acetyltransferase
MTGLKNIVFMSLNRQALYDYIFSRAFNNLKVIPITKHRAISQLNNPRLNDDDILLILALEEGNLAGYLGILPDCIFTINHEAARFGWLSCFWVDPLKRGRGIGMELMQMALKHWENRVLSADYVSHTKGIYKKTRAFGEPLSLHGIKMYFRLDLSTILPPKNKLFYFSRPFLTIADFIANIPLDIRLKVLQKKLKDVNFQYLNEIDPETETFINNFQSGQYFKRSRSELDWITKYPWVIKRNSTERSKQEYYFSSTDKSFDFYKIKIADSKNQPVAFLLFSRRNRSLKIPYIVFMDEYLNQTIDVIVFHIIKWRISTFTTFQPKLVNHLNRHSIYQIYKKSTERNYLVTSRMLTYFEEGLLNIQDGDGDLAFT